MKYKNVSGRDIQTGHVEVEAFVRGQAPTHQVMQKGTRVIELDGPIRVGEQKTMRVPEFSDFGQPKAWLQDVVFRDGPQWSPANASSCAYTSRPARITQHLPTLGSPSAIPRLP